MAMKKKFEEKSTIRLKIDDIGSKILNDYAALKESWPSSVMASEMPSLLEFIALNDADAAAHPDMKKVSYAQFRTLYEGKKLFMFYDGTQTADLNMLMMMHRGLHNFLKIASPPLPHNDQIAIATLAALDPADYLYALTAIANYDGKNLPKSFTYRSSNGRTPIDAYTPFDPEFMIHAYLPARDAVIKEITAAPMKSSIGARWRVPNHPPKPENLF